MAEKKGKGGGHGGGGGGGGHGGGGGGGHSAEKVKAAVESALGFSEVAAYNLLPTYTVAREVFGKISESFSNFWGRTGGYAAGLVWATIYSFGKEILSGVLSKLGGGGH